MTEPEASILRLVWVLGKTKARSPRMVLQGHLTWREQEQVLGQVTAFFGVFREIDCWPPFGSLGSAPLAFKTHHPAQIEGYRQI